MPGSPGLMAARALTLLLLALPPSRAVPADSEQQQLAQLERHAPTLASLLRRVQAGDGAAVAAELRADPHAELAPLVARNSTSTSTGGGRQAAYPVVAASGMGDSCFNAGMQSIAELAGEHLGVYSACVPTGDNVITDTLNSFLMSAPPPSPFHLPARGG